MKKIRTIITILTLMFVLVLPLTIAFGPRTHTQILDLVKQEENKVSILEGCLDGGINEQALRAGTEIPDITVVYYFSEGGKNYKAMHNWNFQQEVTNRAITEDEKCFAWGIAIHLIHDSVSHTQVIPQRIEKTKVPNWITHPLTEKKMDSVLANENPDIIGRSERMLDGMYGSKGERYIKMMEDSLGDNIDFDIRTEIDNLAFALGSFYDDAFTPKVRENSLFVLYPIVDKITNTIHPIVGKWNIKDTNNIVDQTVQLTLNVFENWGSRYALSPHGFSELQEADEKASFIVPMILILLIFFLAVIPLLLIWLTKKFYWAFLFLLIIPILILAITIIYIIL